MVFKNDIPGMESAVLGMDMRSKGVKKMSREKFVEMMREQETVDIYKQMLSGEKPVDKLYENKVALNFEWSRTEGSIPIPRVDNERIIIEDGGQVRSAYHNISDRYGVFNTITEKQTGVIFNEIAINNDNHRDAKFYIDIIMHEFGHMLENDLPLIATQNNKELCKDKHRWADLLTQHLLDPELIDTYADSEIPLVRDTIWCIKKRCEQMDFTEVRRVAQEVIANAEEAKKQWIKRLESDEFPKSYMFVRELASLKAKPNSPRSLADSLDDLVKEGEKSARPT